MHYPTSPFILYNDRHHERVVFFDPVDAMEYIVQKDLNDEEYDLLDSTGTKFKTEKLEESMNTNITQNTEPKPVVEIHTDGACSGNPGPGGYCGIVVFYSKGKKLEKTVKGYSIGTTNNAMELKAVVEALKVLKKPCNVTVYTDSQYLCTCSKHTRPWFEQPHRPNQDLWFEYLEATLVGKHNVTFQKVKGHAGETYNERCDSIAKEQVKAAFHVIYEQGKSLLY